MFLNTIWMECVAKGTTVAENELKSRAKFFARLNTDEEEKYLEDHGYRNWKHLRFLNKGEWHNFTLYVKLGYNENQQPRTVLYLDGVKVVDFETPNAYNCQEFGECMELGIYRWGGEQRKTGTSHQSSKE